jgi:hypothetical protein
METRAFEPQYAPGVGQAQGSLLPSVTVAAVATGATASTQFAGNLSGNGKNQIQIANQAAAWAFVNFGSLEFGAITPATVASSYPVPPNTVVVVSVTSEVSGASVILQTGTGNVTFTRGEGL